MANLTISGIADNKQLQELEEELNNLEMQLSQKVSSFQHSPQEITLRNTMNIALLNPYYCEVRQELDRRHQYELALDEGIQCL